MVEVVQDLLGNVTYAGGVGRRRVDAVRGISVGTPVHGKFHCAVKAEDVDDPTGPGIVGMQELLFHELLDKPFEEKAYHLQLEEFVYRGNSLIAQVEQKLGEVQRMIGHDVLSRSRLLPHYLKMVNDELRVAQRCVCTELDQGWGVRFETFFYPMDMVEEDADDTLAADAAAASEESAGTSSFAGWLDLDDMFLTGRQLTRYLAELVHLIGSVTRTLPATTIDAIRRPGGPPVELHQAITDLGSRLHGLNVLQRQAPQTTSAPLEKASESPDQVDSQRRQRRGTATSQDSAQVDSQRRQRRGTATSQVPPLPSFGRTYTGSPMDVIHEESQKPSGRHLSTASVIEEAENGGDTHHLNEAILALDRILTVHMKLLTSDLHRKMYQTFFRIVAAYSRWKIAFSDECATVRDEAATAHFTQKQTAASTMRRTIISTVKNSKSKISFDARASVADGHAPPSGSDAGGGPGHGHGTRRRSSRSSEGSRGGRRSSRGSVIAPTKSEKAAAEKTDKLLKMFPDMSDLASLRGSVMVANEASSPRSPSSQDRSSMLQLD